MIDSHCHLADAAFAADLESVAARAREAGVTEALCILLADAPDELARVGAVERAWPGVRFAAAVHPHGAGAYTGRSGEAVSVTRQALADTAAVAIGEIGLDYHYDLAPRTTQREVFAGLVALAVETGRAVVVHTREAFDDTEAILREAGSGRVRGVLHCFTGTLDEARRGLDLGFCISLAGIVTFPKAAALRDVAAFVPADRLLVETDAPYLAPVPHRGTRNEPAFVMETARRLAELRGVALADLEASTGTAFRTLLGSAGP
jgi:TatD DNase family protein